MPGIKFAPGGSVQWSDWCRKFEERALWKIYETLTTKASIHEESASWRSFLLIRSWASPSAEPFPRKRSQRARLPRDREQGAVRRRGGGSRAQRFRPIQKTVYCPKNASAARRAEGLRCLHAVDARCACQRARSRRPSASMPHAGAVDLRLAGMMVVSSWKRWTG